GGTLAPSAPARPTCRPGSDDDGRERRPPIGASPGARSACKLHAHRALILAMKSLHLTAAASLLRVGALAAACGSPRPPTPSPPPPRGADPAPTAAAPPPQGCT